MSYFAVCIYDTSYPSKPVRVRWDLTLKEANGIADILNRTDGTGAIPVRRARAQRSLTGEHNRRFNKWYRLADPL